MTEHDSFAPGFRLSAFDVMILVGGAAATGGLSFVDRWVALAVALVVGHFFLFCNVLRMPRGLELIWAGVFAGLAVACAGFELISWAVVFGASLSATGTLSVVAMRMPSYHGVGWRRVNPGLPEWWARRAGGRAETQTMA
jgi:hypothetical protein